MSSGNLDQVVAAAVTVNFGAMVSAIAAERFRTRRFGPKLTGFAAMARRLLLLLAVALVGFGIWLMMRRPFSPTAPAVLAPVQRPAAPTAQPNPAAPKAPPQSVTIQDGKTIDFSSGKAVVKDEAKEKAALEKSLAEIDAATANVTFEPSAPPQKK